MPAERGAAKVEAPVQPPPSRDVVVGTSVKGEPLTLHLFGDGPDSTLIFSGIHGDEPSAAFVGRRLAETLEADPSLATRGTVAVFPLVNPDGLAARTRANANGVDCNRNFPASNWKASRVGRFYTGPAPASEPETRAVIAAIELVRPRRIISVHSPLRCNNFDGPGEELAALLASYNGYPVKPSIGYPTPGSFGSWAGTDLGLPVVTLELPRRTRGEQAWQENRAALLAVVTGAGPANPPAAGPSSPQAPTQPVATPRGELLHDLPAPRDRNPRD